MRKKVLFIINTLRDGGAERILVNIVNHLDPAQYDIEVRLIYRRGVYLDQLNPNVKLTFIAGAPGTFWAKWVSRLLPRLSSGLLHKLFIRGTYDTEVAFLEGYATKIVAGAPEGTHKVAWVHCDVTKTEWITGVFRTEQGFIDCYQKIDVVVSVSESVRDAFIQRFGNVKKHLVKYNPVDDQDIKEKAREHLLVKKLMDCTTLISVGRFMFPKKFIRLLTAIKHLTDKGYRMTLWLLGDGEERTELVSYIENNELADIIMMPGYIANPYPYIQAADLYVCSSIYEGYSTAVTEALILGTPVLTTDVSGMREMLGDSEYGLIVDNDDSAFEEGLKKLLDNPDLLQDYKAKATERGSYFGLRERLKEIEEVL